MGKNISKSLINHLKDKVTNYSSGAIDVRESITPGTTLFYLSDERGLKRNGAHGNQVPVIELNNGFLLYASIAYIHNIKKEDLLGSVSLQFFYESLLLFRAELNRYDKNTGEVKIEHPQPHWHFHIFLDRPYSAVTYKTNFNQFLEQENRFDKMITKEKNLSDMHFLMNFKDGYLRLKSFDETWTEANVKDWIDKTLDSVMKELDFITEKLNLG